MGMRKNKRRSFPPPERRLWSGGHGVVLWYPMSPKEGDMGHPASLLFAFQPKEQIGFVRLKQLLQSHALLGDDTAGDAIAGVAGGIGEQVIGLGVDDERGSTFMEERVGAFGECGVLDEVSQLAIAVGIHG